MVPAIPPMGHGRTPDQLRLPPTLTLPSASGAVTTSPLSRKEHLYPRIVPAGAGFIVLILLMVLPAWNLWTLAKDLNTSYWIGAAGLASNVILFSVCVAMLYVVVVLLPAPFVRGSGISESSATSLFVFFLMLQGLVFTLTPLPLQQRVDERSNALLYNCSTSELTQELFAYSQVLHNIRQEPACRDLKSVELCEGFREAQPHTGLLKAMEKKFHCSGFCYWPGQGNSIEWDDATLSLSEVKRARHSSQTPLVPELAPEFPLLLQLEVTRFKGERETESPFPPALFSHSSLSATCEGMAARQLQSLAGDVAATTMRQGISLLVISGLVAARKLYLQATSKV